MLEFTPLASGSSGNAYHVTSAGHSPLLIEAGVTYKRLQRALNFKVSSLAGALISHSHLDHCKAVPDLLSAGVTCFMNTETAIALNVSAHHNVRIIQAGQSLTISSWTVMPFDMVHDVPCLGFLIVNPAGQKLLYVSDTAHVPYRFEGVTIAAVEANYSRGILQHLVEQGALDDYHAARVIRNHMSIEHAAQVLQRLTGPSLREVHLLHLSNGNSNAADFKEQIERIVGVPVYVAPEKGVLA